MLADIFSQLVSFGSQLFGKLWFLGLSLQLSNLMYLL